MDGMKTLAIAGGILVMLLAAGAGGLYWVQNSPTIAAEAVLQHNRQLLDISAAYWGVESPKHTEQVAIEPIGNGRYQAYFQTEIPEGRRGSLFSITIKKRDGKWWLAGGPALEKEVP